MITSKILNQLIGDRPDLIAQATSEGFVFFVWLSSLQHTKGDWSYFGCQHGGEPLIVDFSESDVPDFGFKSVLPLLSLLKSAGFIYEYKDFGDGRFGASVCVFDRIQVYCIEETIQNDVNVPLANVDFVPTEDQRIPKRPKSKDRRKRAQNIISSTKEHTQERREIASKKRMDRRAANGDVGWATTSTKKHMTNANKPKFTKFGLYSLYVRLYTELMGHEPPSVFNGSRPGKGAGQLNTIVDDYGLPVAYEYVRLLFHNWEEVSIISKTVDLPVPSVVANLRHKICPYIKDGSEDPLGDYRETTEKVRPSYGGKSNERRQAIDADEWKDDNVEKDTGW